MRDNELEQQKPSSEIMSLRDPPSTIATDEKRLRMNPLRFSLSAGHIYVIIDMDGTEIPVARNGSHRKLIIAGNRLFPPAAVRSIESGKITQRKPEKYVRPKIERHPTTGEKRNAFDICFSSEPAACLPACKTYPVGAVDEASPWPRYLPKR